MAAHRRPIAEKVSASLPGLRNRTRCERRVADVRRHPHRIQGLATVGVQEGRCVSVLAQQDPILRGPGLAVAGHTGRHADRERAALPRRLPGPKHGPLVHRSGVAGEGRDVVSPGRVLGEASAPKGAVGLEAEEAVVIQAPRPPDEPGPVQGLGVGRRGPTDPGGQAGENRTRTERTTTVRSDICHLLNECSLPILAPWTRRFPDLTHAAARVILCRSNRRSSDG